MNNKVIYYSDPQSTRSIRKGLEKVFDCLGGLQDIIKSGSSILIKPNLVAPFEKATTNIQVIESIIEFILDMGAKPILGESSGFEFSTASTFHILGINDFKKKYGMQVVNFDECEFVNIKTSDPIFPSIKIPKLIQECESLINLPKLKGHSLTKVTFSLKNLFGLLHRDTRRWMHAVNLERGIQVINKIIVPDLTIVDGLWQLQKAVYSPAEYKGVLVSGRNPALVDYVCCQVFQIDYREIPHIRKSLDNKSIATLNLTIVADHSIEKLKKLGNIKRLKFYCQNRIYQLVYIFDFIRSLFFSGSIIADFHYRFGLHPHINRSKCVSCQKCIEICPVHAIEEKYKIDSEKCKYVRCLKCKEICPVEAIEIIGFHKN